MSLVITAFVAEFDLLKQIGPTSSLARNGVDWSISTSLERYDSYVGWVIGGSAIIGTMIWGYTEWFIAYIA